MKMTVTSMNAIASEIIRGGIGAAEARTMPTRAPERTLDPAAAAAVPVGSVEMCIPDIRGILADEIRGGSIIA